MAKDEIIDGHVSFNQSKLAVEALLSHAVKVQEKKAQTELLPGREQNVWLTVTVKQMRPEKKLKPFRIPLVHPIVDPRVSSVCLITKDPQREYKDLLESHEIRFISRVVGIEKLKGKFKPFEARRMLLKENDLFLADERVVPLLPGLLGKKFFEAKKQPIPVCLTRKDLKGELERAISSTYFHQNQGTCTSVKIGTISQPPSKVLDNLKMALPSIVKRIKGEWDNIQSFHIKTNSSASLPIWSCDLGAADGSRWDGLVAESESEEESESESEMEADEEVKPTKATGKKAVADAPTPKANARKDEVEPMDVDEGVSLTKEHGKGKKRTAEAIVDTPQKKAKADTTLSSVTETGSKSSTIDTGVPRSPAVTPPTINALARGNPGLSVSPAEASAPSQASSTIPASTKEPTSAGDADEVAASSRRRKKRKAANAEPTTADSEVPAHAGPMTAPAEAHTASSGPASTHIPEDTAATGRTKRRKRSKGVAAEASKEIETAVITPVSVPLEPTVATQPSVEGESNAAPSKPRKRKHMKAITGATTPSEIGVSAATDPIAPATPPQSASAAVENSEVSTKKRRKKVKAATIATEVDAGKSSEAAVVPPAIPAVGEKASTSGVPPEPSTPATPSVTKRKRRRASAVDFFEAQEHTATSAPTIPVPPNTPATGLAAVTPSTAAKERKPVNATHLEGALAQVANEPSDASPEKAGTTNLNAPESPLLTKKPRKRKSKAALLATSDSVQVPDPVPTTSPAAPTDAAEAARDSTQPKKVKRKHLRAAAAAAAAASVETASTAAIVPPTPTPQGTTPTMDGLKKKRGAARGEKKKDKALGAAPAAKSAKDAVVGKKHL